VTSNHTRANGGGRPELQRILAVLPESPSVAREIARHADPQLFIEAATHGVLHVLYGALREDLPASTRTKIEETLAVAALENELALRALRASLAALRDASVRCVVLKGPILAERLYGSAFVRPSIDIDVLIDEAALEPALRALSLVGYERAREGPYAEAGRHHVILFHRVFPNFELHFHAHAGFGRRIEAAGLLNRAAAWSSAAAQTDVPVLSAEDELVYLAVHAATHHFTRLVWLYDLKLLAGRLTRTEIETAAERAQAWGFRRVLSLTSLRLAELGVAPDVLLPFGRIGFARRAILERVTDVSSSEPGMRSDALGSLTRFVYSVSLCDTADATGRYAHEAVRDYIGRRL
jgi:hypothetical protein